MKVTAILLFCLSLYLFLTSVFARSLSEAPIDGWSTPLRRVKRNIIRPPCKKCFKEIPKENICVKIDNCSEEGSVWERKTMEMSWGKHVWFTREPGRDLSVVLWNDEWFAWERRKMKIRGKEKRLVALQCRGREEEQKWCWKKKLILLYMNKKRWKDLKMKKEGSE